MAKFTEYLLVKLKGNLNAVNIEQQEVDSKIEGEMTLIVSENEDKSVDIILNKMGWYGMGMRVGKDHTGKISCMASAKRGTFRSDQKSMSFSVHTTGEVTYKAIEEKLGLIWISDHMSAIPPEEFFISISGRLVTSRSARSKTRYSVRDLTIEMNYQSGGIGLVRGLRYIDKSPSLFRLVQSSPLRGLANFGNCHPGLEVNQRTLTIQPVGFRNANNDPNPTGASLNVQMASASAIWGKCCINFNVLPINLIVNAALKTSSNLGNIRASFVSPTANVIEVFFVDNNLPAQGGGVADSCNSALGNIVMSDNNAGNPQLLAHELGHILGLTHPGLVFGGCVIPDSNTVMQPSGSPNVPNSTNNTHWNCINVANPALSTSIITCCLTHDIPNTIIRDFPEDSGVETNPGFPGRNFYSMSNVWNRLQNNAGGINGDGTRQHENPARFEADGTTLHTNYLFAKVEALVNLQIRDAEVRFYMKHPGAGSGAANIQLLGTVPVPATLTSANSEIVSLPWNIPAGSPGHSCTFSVVHTPAEPAEDITSLNWQQTEQLIRDDNDWAQRNLTIDNTFPNFGNIDFQQITFPPIFIEYPIEKGLKPVPFSLNAKISKLAKSIEYVELSIPAYRKSISLKRGKSITLHLSENLRPGSRIMIIARAILNPNEMTFGNQIDLVELTPTIGEIELVGYGFSTKMTKTSDVINQVMDRAIGAFHDLGELTGSGALEEMCQLVRQLRSASCTSPYSIVAYFREKTDAVKLLQEVLFNEQKEAYKFAEAQAAFDNFFELISSNADATLIFDAIRDLINRIEIMNWLVYSKL